MRKRFFILLLLCGGISGIVFGQSTNLREYVEELKKSTELANAAWSLKVQNCKTGAVLASYNPQLGLVPASVAKLATTGSALNLLGKNFRFKTNIMYDGTISETGVLKGNLYIVGGGDPFLGSYRYKQTQPDSVFDSWRESLQKLGIKSIDGNIAYDASIFDNELIPGSWAWEDFGNYYGCGASGLSFHENMYQIYFNPGTAQKQPAKIASIKPAVSNLLFENKVTTAAAGTGDCVIIYGIPYNITRLLTGTIPLGENNFCVRGSLPDPAHTCADMFRLYLIKQRIPVSGMVSNASDYSAAQKRSRKSVMEYNSYTLEDIVELTNKQSNNMYAECIFKYLGYAKYDIGTYENGSKAVFDYLKSNNIDIKGIKINDGSGLSQRDMITSNFLCNFLMHMTKTSSFDSFYNSLARVKRSGNLDKLLQTLPAQKNTRLKTGSMEGVRSYAGYTTNEKGEQLCFSMVVNNFDCSSTEIRNIMDKFLFFVVKGE